MQVSKRIYLATLVSMIALGASAEEYQGVLQFSSNASRSEVRAEASVAARMPNPYADGADSGPADVMTGALDRSAVRAQAFAAARAGNLYGDAAAAGVTPRAPNLAQSEGAQPTL